jgi:glycine betaine/proline transport system substrate-binding protein
MLNENAAIGARWRAGLRVVALLISIVAVPASAEMNKIKFGQIRISFYAVAGAVVQEALTKLGHEVEVVEGLHPEIFPKLGAGEVDVLVAAWLPYGHAEYWQKYGDCCVEIATLYEGAKFFWAVPDYVPKDAVASVGDLTKPDVAARMEKLIKGTDSGSGLMIQSRKMMEAYGLTAAGYVLEPSPGNEWIVRLKEVVAKEQWIATPLWQPQYLNKAMRLRKLDEPQGLMGGENRAVFVMSKKLAERLPEASLRVLRRIHLGIDAVTEMDYRVNVENKTPREAALDWMRQNQTLVDGWYR